MPLKKRVTLADIAQIAGVHHTTVSLALRNRPELPGETRKRIREIADRLGYRPDPALSALRNYRRRPKAKRSRYSIAFVTAFDRADYWRQIPAYARRYAGMVKRAEQLGYHLETFWFDRKNMTPQRASQILRARNIAGLVIAPLPSPATLDLDWRYFACVSLTFSLQPATMHVVCNWFLDTVRLTYEQLRRLGYHRFGLALEQTSDERVLRAWSTGALGEHARLPLRERVPPHLPIALEKGKFLTWYHTHRPGVIVTIPPHLQMITAWLRQSAVRVPKDVGVASLDLPHPDTEASGVYQNPEVIGMAAIDVLSGLIQHNDLGLPDHPQSIFMRGYWIDGATTQSVAGTAAPALR